MQRRFCSAASFHSRAPQSGTLDKSTMSQFRKNRLAIRRSNLSSHASGPKLVVIIIQLVSLCSSTSDSSDFANPDGSCSEPMSSSTSRSGSLSASLASHCFVAIMCLMKLCQCTYSAVLSLIPSSPTHNGRSMAKRDAHR